VKLLSSVSAIFCSLVITLALIGSAQTLYAASNAQPGSSAANISGNWQLSFEGRNGDQRQVSMQLDQDGSKLSGTFEGERGSVPLHGTLQGNQVSITVKSRRRGTSFTGTVDGDKMSGKTKQGGSWTATRQ
jgi:hypothetical protein